ncbi:hypothetical protein [Paenibacillus spongiae]|uniref:Uncharacterized protein n=1 Tax=Paenibacillus spongiae TaxID=2909671 RepID=A0ABY5SAL6_9BACL|nr:hypothetical protein [Paenibacillus spongiae]UVI30784.1 hypothetical protein L1F29_02580 [Paenibacillus spongiae]
MLQGAFLVGSSLFLGCVLYCADKKVIRGRFVILWITIGLVNVGAAIMPLLASVI